MTNPAPIINALTIDVEDYFQVSAFERVVARERWGEYESRVAANTDRLLGILAEADVRVTFFVLGWVAERDAMIVKRIAGAGHEIASHGYGHRLVYNQTRDEFREDIRRAKGVLEAAGGKPVMGYRAPSFSITERSLWALDILIEEGFTYDASIFPIHHDRYGIPNAPRHPFWISAGAGSAGAAGAGNLVRVGGDHSPGAVNGPGLLEIPGSTIRVGGVNFPAGGGGFFRLLPYWWTRAGIRRVNETEGRPAIFYLHPWEVDPNQPRLAASPLSRFRHYCNLAKTEPRLRRLLGDFRFGTIAETIAATV
ncbi:MAG: DUF3473 domain-containing protein [Acidobacteria bacterium]|nr:DUF3473 domain-containing protein [Acidobacteriota bacterium]